MEQIFFVNITSLFAMLFWANAIACAFLLLQRAAAFEEQPGFSFSVSIGVACGVPSLDQGFEDIIAKADRCIRPSGMAGIVSSCVL